MVGKLVILSPCQFGSISSNDHRVKKEGRLSTLANLCFYYRERGFWKLESIYYKWSDTMFFSVVNLYVIITKIQVTRSTDLVQITKMKVELPYLMNSLRVYWLKIFLWWLLWLINEYRFYHKAANDVSEHP